MISLSAWLRLNSCLLVNFRKHSSLPWTGPTADPLCPCSVGTGRQEEICTAQFGFAGALAGFWDVLTRLAELLAQLLLKVLLAAKEAWGPAFTDPWNYRVWKVLPAHPTLIWKDFSFQTDSDTFRCSKNQILQTGGTSAASPNCPYSSHIQLTHLGTLLTGLFALGKGSKHCLAKVEVPFCPTSRWAH